MNAQCYLLRSAKGLIGCIVALVVLAGMVSNAPAQGLRYIFDATVDDLTVPGGIHDVSGNGHDGTVIDSNLAEFTTGPAGNMNAIHIDKFNAPDETVGSGINTGIQTDHPDLNIFQGPFTCMAWINLDDQSGDHMVFGTPNPNAPGSGEPRAGSLHLGFRGTQIYYGFWGAGVMRDSNSPGGLLFPGCWHHVAYRFDAAMMDGTQDIFLDGCNVNSAFPRHYYGGLLLENNSVPNVPVNLLIGRTPANNGAFSGSLSDVRVYNTNLSDDDIAAIAAIMP